MKNNNKEFFNDRTITALIIGIAVLITIVIGVIIYNNINGNNNDYTQLSKGTANIITTTNENTESANSKIGKSVEESKNNTVNTTNVTNTSTKNNTNNVTKNQISTNSAVESKNETESTTKETVSENEKMEFVKPVEGEIMAEFAKDQLVYSETLKEWTTHLGVDIKADETSVVVAAEEGTVKSIKNDPRYGLTVVIEHKDGFQTVYSNLLTSEFVVEGEKVEKGQSIGTVGNTAAFEAKQDPHLHFEILKDFEQVDPNLYIN